MGSKPIRSGVEIKVSRSVVDFLMCVLYSCVSRMKGKRFQLRCLSAGNSTNATEKSDWPTRIDCGVVPITCDPELYGSSHV